MTHIARALAPLACIALAACGGGTDPSSSAPSSSTAAEPAASPTVATAADTATYSGIAAGEKVHFTGTEPFWGGEVSDGVLTYTTPENQAGEMVAVDRFAGRNGISFSGELDGKPFVMAVTPGKCSDGMSDRTYPFTVSLKIGDDLRNGCGWTDRTPFEGPAQP
jgi:uncharacterized membrane protein